MGITAKEAKMKYNLTGEKYDTAEIWDELSRLPLPEELIREAADKVDWTLVSTYSKLSENFIEEFQDKVCWEKISSGQKLSERFIRKFKDYIDWDEISLFQKLSENFIREFKDEVGWFYISQYQKLSEDFIREFEDYINKECLAWYCISGCQQLSENFIREYKDKVYWDCISKYQVVSKEFLAEFGYELKNNSDKPTSYWKERVQETKLYECHEDFFYAYKRIRSDRYSIFTFQYRYMPGETYECFSDYSEDKDSFGLSAWTKEMAEYYCNGLAVVVKVKIYYKDVTAVVNDGGNDGKIRCKKLTVVN